MVSVSELRAFLATSITVKPCESGDGGDGVDGVGVDGVDGVDCGVEVKVVLAVVIVVLW